MISITPLHSKISSFLLNRTNDKFIENGGLDQLKEEISDLLIGILPHGSGIDCDWTTKYFGTILECFNSYHVIDGNEYYCGYVSFTVKFNIESLEFDVITNKEDIQTILAGYAKEMTEDENEDYMDTEDPSPYLDDLDDDIYSRVEYSLEQYVVRESIRFAKKHYPDILEQELKVE